MYSTDQQLSPPPTTQLPTQPRPPSLPTAPCSVVWSGGHSYVLEGSGLLGGRSLWVGLDDHGRPTALSPQALRDRGWTLSPS